MLPKLLPNRFRAPLKGRVDLRGGIFLHRGRDVAVEVEGQRDGRMAEPLLCDAGMNAGQQKLGSVRMTQIVEPNCRQILKLADEFEEHVAEPERRRRLAVGARTDQRASALPDAEL